MYDRPRSDHRSASVIRLAVHRFAYLGLVLAAIGLMVLGKADTVLMERIRVTLADSVAPILDTMARPADAIADVVRGAERWINLHEENARLRAEHDRLFQWQAVALRLEEENRMLRQLLNFTPGPQARSVSARVIADSGGAFARSMLLYGGAADGIGKGDAVLTGEGLVGRIVSVARRSARTLLITDLNSRVPVVISPNRTRAILAGNNTKRPHLVHVTAEAPVARGDRVVTSGDAAAFPPGLPIGVVAAVSEDGIEVQPYAELSRLEVVRVVDFGLDGILSDGPATKRP